MSEGTKETWRSSGSARKRWAFHVFLSFRGEDTRKTFTDHLYAALQRKGIKTFRDDEEIAKGEVVSLQLPKAIEESLSYIVILSQDYASSTWCLDELQEILESRKELGRDVFPIFYGVDPSHVRHQKGSFENAMTNHEKRFGKDSEKVRKWRDALKEIANISGFDTRNLHETQVIENIAEAVWSRVRDKLPSYPNILVGIDSKIEEIDLLLDMGLDDVLFIGICGMGGIGKTTIARVVFERIGSTFEYKSFLHNVREVSERDGLPSLQKKILSHLKLRNIEIDHPDDGKNIIRNLLFNKKVLLVLDDINHWRQLQNLAGNQDWFGPGSRVIVTTRDSHLLTFHGVCKKYEVQVLKSSESLQLFCQKAFKKYEPEEGFLDLSKNAIKYAGGLPLALEVLGSYLCGKSIPQWKSALDKMRQFPEEDILKPLRVSYEALDVPNKNIFLDFACFLKGMDKDRVVQIMDACGLYPITGIQDLIDKSLLTEYFDHGRWHLEMHQMLQEMGKNIVLQESPFDVSKRCRLWSQEDIEHVLANNKGTELIQGIVLELPEPYEAQWHPEAFAKMCNLRLLILSNVLLPQGLNCLSSALKVLEWKGYPLKFLPLEVRLDELADLKLQHSKIRQLWNGNQFFGKLKFIDLSQSKDLRKTPDFIGIPSLERLFLEGCVSLTEIHPSIAEHNKLVVLNLKDCKSLKSLPRKLEMNSLKDFVLSGCSNIRKLPEFGEKMINLSVLDLEGTSISKLPDSLVCLTSLADLNLRNCKNIVCLPSTIWDFKLLRSLDISGCPKFSSLPENLNENEALEELNVGGTAIREVPSSIVHFKKLKNLSLSGCKGSTSSSSWSLQLPFVKKFKFWKDQDSTRFRLPPSISHVTSLQILNLSYCNLSVGLIPEDFGSRMPSLKDLNLKGNRFDNVAAGSSWLPFRNLTSLNILNLSDCNLCDGSISNDLQHLSSLQQLNFMGNRFTNLPANCLSHLKELQLLWINACPNLQSLPELPPNLVRLDASDNVSLEEALSDPKQLWSIFASLDLQRSEEEHVVLQIPGSEVPSWFENGSFYFDEDVRNRYGYDSAVSIVAHVPNSWRSSEWSGIAVCLVLEGQVWEDLWERVVFWCSKDPDEDEWPRNIWGYDVQGWVDRPQLFIRFLPFNHENCWQHVRGEKNQLQLMLATKTRPRRGVQNLQGPKPRNLEIKKCGWRALCKEDVEEYWRLLSAATGACGSSCSSNTNILSSGDSMGLHKDKRIRDVFEADGSATDAEAQGQKQKQKTGHVQNSDP